MTFILAHNFNQFRAYMNQIMAYGGQFDYLRDCRQLVGIDRPEIVLICNPDLLEPRFFAEVIYRVHAARGTWNYDFQYSLEELATWREYIEGRYQGRRPRFYEPTQWDAYTVRVIPAPGGEALRFPVTHRIVIPPRTPENIVVDFDAETVSVDEIMGAYLISQQDRQRIELERLERIARELMENAARLDFTVTGRTPCNEPSIREIQPTTLPYNGEKAMKKPVVKKGKDEYISVDDYLPQLKEVLNKLKIT
jgi:hypothetical protein